MPTSTTRKKPAKKTAKKAASPKRTQLDEAPPQQDTAQSVPMPADPTDKYAPNAWLSGGIGSTVDLEVPSGQLCLVRRPGLQGLMKAGVLRNVDSLSALVSEKHLQKGKQGKKSDQVDIGSIMRDTKALDDVLHTVDRVVTHCVVKPEVQMTPNDVTRRKPGVVYADMVDIVDKMFIFNFVVGGTHDLDTFRGELDGALGSVEAREGVQQDSE